MTDDRERKRERGMRGGGCFLRENLSLTSNCFSFQLSVFCSLFSVPFSGLAGLEFGNKLTLNL